MLRKLKDFWHEQQLFTPSDSILVAVSGGVDSMVLIDILHQEGISFSIGHCNFKLRGQDSEEDEAFIRNTANHYGVPFYTTAFDTRSLAKTHKTGIQELARTLRYQWLENIRQQHQYHWIATAHHLDDSIETALFNWAKGCGLNGIQGIPAKNGHIIRPLHALDKVHIVSYAKNEQINYREDISNTEEKYARNKIRHQAIPALKSINPSLTKTFNENFRRLAESAYWEQQAIAQLKKEVWQLKDGLVFIQLAPLKVHFGAATALHYWLSPLGFNHTQIRQMLHHEEIGAQFIAPKHTIIRDREALIISTNQEIDQFQTFQAAWDPRQNPTLLLPKGRLEATNLQGHPKSFPEDQTTALLDHAQLKFPLQVRTWNPGDTITPLGMHGKHQKVKELLTNRHVNRINKSKTLVMTSGRQICWVIGHRLSESFKIAPETESYWQFKLVNEWE